MNILDSILKLLEEKNNYPELDIGNRCGGTGYIDFITMEEVTNSIMWGRDIYNRYFLVFKLLIEGKIVLQTLFERYSDKKYRKRSFRRVLIHYYSIRILILEFPNKSIFKVNEK